MSLLNRLFSSPETLAQRAEEQEKDLRRIWSEYLQTIPEKERLIRQLALDRNVVSRLQQLLTLELVDVKKEVQDEKDLKKNLLALTQDTRIKRVQRLQDCLGYAFSKHQYLFELLLRLYATLKAEATYARKLSTAKQAKFRKLSQLLNLELQVEKVILTKISSIQTFHELFEALVTGEHIIQRLSAKEKRIARAMSKGSITENGITEQWVNGVCAALEDKVSKVISTGKIIAMNPGLDFEFVNRPEFVGLARHIAIQLRGKISEEMLKAFVHTFRQWYNYERS